VEGGVVVVTLNDLKHLKEDNMKQFMDIRIVAASNGVTVFVGCLKVVYQQTQLEMFLGDLTMYLQDPKGAEDTIRKRWDITMETPEEATPDQAACVPLSGALGEAPRPPGTAQPR